MQTAQNSVLIVLCHWILLQLHRGQLWLRLFRCTDPRIGGCCCYLPIAFCLSWTGWWHAFRRAAIPIDGAWIRMNGAGAGLLESSPDVVVFRWAEFTSA